MSIRQGVEVKAGGATFKSVLERTPALHERFYLYARKHALYDQVDHLILDAQAEARKKRPRGLVVILDSLDHLSDPSEKSGTTTKPRGLFFRASAWLGAGTEARATP